MHARQVLALLALLGLTLGCLVRNDGEHPTTGGAPATFTVRNHTEHEVCYVTMWPSGEDDDVDEDARTEDWLGPSETIRPGASRTFQVTAGTWHVRMQDCAHQLLFDRDGIAVADDIELDFRTIERPAP